MTQAARHSPGVVLPLLVAMTMATAVACRGRASAANGPPTVVLRVGVSLGVVAMTNPGQGIGQIVQNVTTEGLARVMPDGRMMPQLADKWIAHGQTLTIDLKPGLRFSDGSALDANVVAASLPDLIRDSMGFASAGDIRARIIDSQTVRLDLPYPSSLWVEALEAPIRKPGAPAIAVGPFSRDSLGPMQLRATDDYYLGRPAIDIIDYKPFSSVRSAWAELLRNNIDMLYEVGPDALDSLESSRNVSVFTFVRPYQYNVSFNAEAAPLRSPAVRQALNFAIDRDQLIRTALNGHGIASTGPLRRNHWAIESVQGFAYDPQRAARLLNGRHVRFTCLLPTDATYERIGLEIKRQLALVGVEMELKAMPPDELFAAEQARDYDASLHETISGPTLLRLYLVWHSSGGRNMGRGTPGVDVALDRVRTAADETRFREAIDDVQRAFVDDPPAMLLAWSERARAVSNRFVVPAPEPGIDVLATMRLWKPGNDRRFANRN